METNKSGVAVESSVLSRPALEETIKADYFPEHGKLTGKLWFRSIHDTYIIRCDGREYFFKVYRLKLRTETEIRAEIDLLLHLEKHGIPAIKPMRRKDGDYICRFTVPEGERYGVLYPVVGVSPARDIQETAAYNNKLGLYVSSVHKAWNEIDHPIDRWHLDIASFIDRSMDFVRSYAQWYSFDIDFLEEVAKKTKDKIDAALSKNQSEYGLCHGDINTGNIRLDTENNPVLIDFDFCGYGWRLYDISVYLNAFSLGFDKTGMKKRKRRTDAFLEGYTRNMPLPEKHFASMSLFVPFRRIFNIGTLYISMSSTWGDEWVRSNLDEDIGLLKSWAEISGF